MVHGHSQVRRGVGVEISDTAFFVFAWDGKFAEIGFLTSMT